VPGAAAEPVCRNHLLGYFCNAGFRIAPFTAPRGNDRVAAAFAPGQAATPRPAKTFLKRGFNCPDSTLIYPTGGVYCLEICLTSNRFKETILATRENEARSSEAHARAEASFKKEERARDGAKAMMEYQANGRAVREKMARLRALRLAKEAADKERQGADEPAPRTQRKR
jgi:hypothetical protein